MSYSPKRRLIRERVTLLALVTVHARIVCSQTPVPHQMPRGPEFLWPTVKELIWFTISLSTFNFRLINSSCSAAVDRVRNSSEKISSSTVEIGRSPSCLGLGLNSQHRPVNFPYARRSEYSASRSPWFGCQSKVVYPGFVGGNISAIHFREISGAFRFFHEHSTSVRIKL